MAKKKAARKRSAKTAPKPAPKTADKPAPADKAPETASQYQPIDEVVEGDAVPAGGLSTPEAGVPPDDRMLRQRRNPACPSCGAHPTVCTSRRPLESTHRCRVCSARWSVVQIKDE